MSAKSLVMMMVAVGCLAVTATSSPAVAAALPVGPSPAITPRLFENAQTYGGGRFRRCMRAKYGPRYFAGVPRAHRFHMAQACRA
jgi:hypothetical protein